MDQSNTTRWGEQTFGCHPRKLSSAHSNHTTVKIGLGLGIQIFEDGDLDAFAIVSIKVKNGRRLAVGASIPQLELSSVFGMGTPLTRSAGPGGR